MVKRITKLNSSPNTTKRTNAFLTPTAACHTFYSYYFHTKDAFFSCYYHCILQISEQFRLEISQELASSVSCSKQSQQWILKNYFWKEELTQTTIKTIQGSCDKFYQESCEYSRTTIQNWTTKMQIGAAFSKTFWFSHTPLKKIEILLIRRWC